MVEVVEDHYNNAGADPGGSGGGTGRRSSTDISYGYNPTTPTAVLTAVPLPDPYTLTQGYPGGVAGGTSTDGGGGGGGAGAAGSAGGTGNGGVGVAGLFSGDTAVPTDYGDTGPISRKMVCWWRRRRNQRWRYWWRWWWW